MKILLNFYKTQVIPQKVSLICLEDGDDSDQSKKNLVGYNFLGVSKNGDIDDPSEFVNFFKINYVLFIVNLLLIISI